MKMSRAQYRFLAHVRDWHDGQLDGRCEAGLQTGLYAAAYDAVAGAVVRRGWLTHENTLTDAGRAKLEEVEARNRPFPYDLAKLQQ